MSFYNIEDYKAAYALFKEPEKEEWMTSKHANMGEALKYLLAVERWVKKNFKEKEYAVWQVEAKTNEIRIFFSNDKTATLFSLAGVEASDIEDT